MKMLKECKSVMFFLLKFGGYISSKFAFHSWNEVLAELS
jgi:hypothetical protein